MIRLLCLALVTFAACLGGCPPPTPPVPPPDASDASALEAAPAPPPAACTQACAAMAAVGCFQLPMCAAVLANVEARRLKIDPSITTGDNHLTCAALTTVQTLADVAKHGWDCGAADAGASRR